NVSSSVLQLAMTGAYAPGSQLNISNSFIWSQGIQAENGGKVTISNAQIYGNYFLANGAGSPVTLLCVYENRKATAATSCAPVNGYPPNSDGVPLCNPFNPLGQCSQVSTSNGGAVTGMPACN